MFPDIITTEEQLNEAVAYFMQFDAFAFDTEGMGPFSLIPKKTELVWISLATYGRAIAIPFGHPNGRTLIQKATRKKNPVTKKFDQFPAQFSPPPEQLRPSQVFAALRPLFYSDRRKIGANLPFDLVSISKYTGGICPGPYADVITKQWLLNENFEARIKNPKSGAYYYVPRKGLKPLTEHYFGVKYDVEDVGKDISRHTFSTVGKYACLDAKYTWLLDKLFEPQMDPEDLVFTQQMEEELIGVVSRMSDTGAPAMAARFEELRVEFRERVVQAKTDIYRAAGKNFDIGSVPQRQEILYGSRQSGGQALKSVKLTPAGKKKRSLGRELTIYDYSTDSDSLEAHADNSVVQSLQAHADVDKLLGYLNKYLGDPAKGTPSIIFGGRIYAQFKPDGTVSGRFSSSEPNLQNVPAHGPDAMRFRAGFEAPPGYKEIVGDYSQVELRMLAHFIGHGRLYDGFLAGVDAHTSTASAVFGVRLVDVTKEMRQVAKGLNFAIVFGAGPATVAAMAGIKLAEAKRFMKLHQKLFPEIYAFIARVIERCRSREIPHIRTMSGQFRRLPEITRKGAVLAARRTFKGETYNEKQFEARVWSIQSRAERQAVNSLIQGSAAYLIKRAMIRADAAFEADFEAHGRNEDDHIRLCLTVHDELMAVARDHRVEDAKAMLTEAMLGEEIQSLLRVPLESDVKAAQRWSDAK